MAEVLSQKQIDELLGKLQSGNVDFEEIEEQSLGKKIKDYDFTSPKKFTREQLKLLNTIFDGFSRFFSLHLSSMLRIACQTEVVQVEEEEYKEFNNALDDSVMVGVIGMNNNEYNIDGKQILLEMSRPISFYILDRMLGGNGSGYKVERDYTEIEISLLEYLLKQIIVMLNNAWSNYLDVEHTVDAIETNSRLLQFIQQDESVAIVVVEIKFEELKGNINICLPSTVLEDFFKIFNSKYAKVQKKNDAEQEKLRKEAIITSLKNSPLTVSALLGKTEITLAELLQLQTGDIIPLDTPAAGNPVKVYVEKTCWANATVGVKKKKYAVKIVEGLQ